MRADRDKSVGCDGFTLVETLVSLALLSLIAIYALQSFRTMKQMDTICERIQAQNEVDAAAHMLKEEISVAKQAFSDIGTPQQRLLFEGREHSMTYVIASSGNREVGGLYLVNLFLSEHGSLELTRQLIRSNGIDQVERVTLINNVQSLNFEYLDKAKVTNTWLGQQRLPSIAKIEIAFNASDHRHFPEFLTNFILRN